MTTTIGSTKWHFQARKDFIFPINQSTSHFWDIPLNNHGTHVGTISILKVKHICGRSLPTLHALRHPHWHQYLLVWGHQYPNCIHISNTSILKTHTYWHHINTQRPQLVHHRWPQRYLLHFLQTNPSLLQSCCQRRKRLILFNCIWKKAARVKNYKPNKSIILEPNS